MTAPRITTRQGLTALSPAIMFLLLYVAVSIIIGDFYVMPITVALLAASAWGIMIDRKDTTLHQRIEYFSESAGHSNILYMVWIFVMAGAFASLAKGIGAIDATVELTLSLFPSHLILPAIFMASCFISLAIGTSVGTIVAIVPLVVELAAEGGGNIALFVATALGGAFFGDNLSFISDTTIAATRTQGCGMSEKFRANLRMVLPAALITVTIYFFLGRDIDLTISERESNPWMVLPYLLVIISALCGLNVLLVLSLGIVSAMLLGMSCGNIAVIECCRFMGNGVNGMGELIVITMLAAGMLGIVKKLGGIEFLLQRMTSRVTGKRGAQVSIAALVSLVNLCTANNTVAILSVGSISKSISSRYGISPRRTASILDTCSCIVQSLIPYGAQTLLATGLAKISPAAPWPYLYYPWALAGAVALAIILPSVKMKPTST
ncbi:MAG: Na+/H+ antiporter NhaC family protein [Paramuribaculum sp.]|nr:Na+/H+ antiporter NhaC family protein [Paramuribaculum sp.]MDE6323427.1 Na+/H+ antiporter NhaC family protein [Paramuribaculum sp.]